MEIENNSIVIKPIKKEPRKDWEQFFKKMHENKDDQLLVDDKNDLDMAYWEW